MFATLAVLSVAAVFVSSWQVPVLLFALGSVVTFLVLWMMIGVRSPSAGETYELT